MRVYCKGMALGLILLLVLLLLRDHFRSKRATRKADTGSDRPTHTHYSWETSKPLGAGAHRRKKWAAIHTAERLPSESEDVLMDTEDLDLINRLDEQVINKQKTLEEMDIRELDPLSATEPMVIRQQEELEEQGFGIQPEGETPGLPDALETWLLEQGREEVGGRSRSHQRGSKLRRGRRHAARHH